MTCQSTIWVNKALYCRRIARRTKSEDTPSQKTSSTELSASSRKIPISTLLPQIFICEEKEILAGASICTNWPSDRCETEFGLFSKLFQHHWQHYSVRLFLSSFHMSGPGQSYRIFRSSLQMHLALLAQHFLSANPCVIHPLLICCISRHSFPLSLLSANPLNVCALWNFNFMALFLEHYFCRFFYALRCTQELCIAGSGSHSHTSKLRTFPWVLRHSMYHVDDFLELEFFPASTRCVEKQSRSLPCPDITQGRQKTWCRKTSSLLRILDFHELFFFLLCCRRKLQIACIRGCILLPALEGKSLHDRTQWSTIGRTSRMLGNFTVLLIFHSISHQSALVSSLKRNLWTGVSCPYHAESPPLDLTIVYQSACGFLWIQTFYVLIFSLGLIHMRVWGTSISDIISYSSDTRSEHLASLFLFCFLILALQNVRWQWKASRLWKERR